MSGLDPHDELLAQRRERVSLVHAHLEDVRDETLEQCTDLQNLCWRAVRGIHADGTLTEPVAVHELARTLGYKSKTTVLYAYMGARAKIAERLLVEVLALLSHIVETYDVDIVDSIQTAEANVAEPQEATLGEVSELGGFNISGGKAERLFSAEAYLSKHNTTTGLWATRYHAHHLARIGVTNALIATKPTGEPAEPAETEAVDV